MGTMPFFKIVVLEDDDFYNKLLSRYLKTALSELGIVKGFGLEVKSYTSLVDCTLNFDNDTILMFTDYYLKDRQSASNIIDFVNSRPSACKIVVISQIQNLQTEFSSLLKGAIDFIKKDKQTFYQCRDIAESVITEKMVTKN